MKNITTLRQELCEVFEQLKKGKLDAKQAKEINNAAGKIIGTIKVELEYCALTKAVPDIDFFQKD